MAQKTLMVGLNEKDMGAVVRGYDLKPFYYPTLFPIKETKRLEWKVLEAQTGLKIAADLVSRGATPDKKTREAISRIQGDIPKIMISREMLEDELTDYDIAVAMASSNEDLKTLVEFWADDTKFCWEGVASRVEWVALRQISLGKIKFTNSNNTAVVTEYDIDYQMDPKQKTGVSVSYSVGSSAKPLSVDIPKALKCGKSIGAKYKFLFMNPETFEKFAAQEEVYKRCASFLQNVAKVVETPSVADVNAYLAKKPETFKGLQIVVIDQDITIELADGTRETSNPFEEDVMLFSESKILGNTFWKKPIDAKAMPGSNAIKVMHGHTLVKKYSQESPVTEVTEGIANIFPAWSLSGRSFLMQTNATSWTK